MIATPLSTFDQPRENQSVEEKAIFRYTGWFDATTAPVATAARIRIKVYKNDEVKGTTEDDIVIEGIGTGAKSRLPDNK